MPVQLATMTAARAIIKMNGVPVGYMKNLKVSENKQRGSVMGLGEVTKKERPLLGITCTWSCDFYMIDLTKTGVPGADNRQVQTVNDYKNTQVLMENAVDVYIYKKDVGEVTGTSPSQIVTTVAETVFAVRRDVYLDNTSWSLTENQISDFNQSGEYLQPIILSL